jgi:hypothetical protein
VKSINITISGFSGIVDLPPYMHTIYYLPYPPKSNSWIISKCIDPHVYETWTSKTDTFATKDQNGNILPVLIWGHSLEAFPDDGGAHVID